MPAFEFIVLKPIKIGDKTLQPGEVTIEPNTWSARTLKVYTDVGTFITARRSPRGSSSSRPSLVPHRGMKSGSRSSPG